MANRTSTTIKGFSKETLTLKRSVRINNMQHITGITEDTSTGKLWLIGFNMLENIPDYPSPYDAPFYYPVLANIPLDSNEAQVRELQGNYDLAMPMSIIWTSGH
jgi:hypothetical protein